VGVNVSGGEPDLSQAIAVVAMLSAVLAGSMAKLAVFSMSS